MAIKPPETTTGKITLGAALLAVLASFTTVGSAIVMWEQVRPWQSETEIRESVDRDKEFVRELTKHKRELEREDAEIKARACENTLARLKSSLYAAQGSEISAVERHLTLADPDAKALNTKMIQQSRESQHTFTEQYEHEKKECDF